MSLNKAMIIGNLGRDPEMRYTPNGQAVTQFTRRRQPELPGPATASGRKRPSGSGSSPGAPLAERTAENLRKGRKVYVEGRLQTRQWEDKDGQKRYTTELIASQVTSLDRAQRDEGDGRRSSAVGRAVRRLAAPRQPARRAPPAARRPTRTSTTCPSDPDRPHVETPPRRARRDHDEESRTHGTWSTRSKKRDEYYRDRRRRKVCAFCADKTVRSTTRK